MTRIVDTKPALINPNLVASSIAVRASTWSDAAQAINASLGAGSVLISSTWIGDTIPAGATFTYRFRSRPTLFNSRLVWQIRASCPFPQATITGTFTAAQLVGLPVSTGGLSPVYLFETYTLNSTDEQEYTLTFTADSKGAVFVESLALVELPRTGLLGSEGGIPVNTQRVGSPIQERPEENMRAIAAATATAILNRRRVGIYHYFTRSPLAFTSTTFAAFLRDSVPVLLRATTVSGGTRSVSCRVYAQQTTNDSGEFRFSSAKNASSATATVTVGGGLKWWPDATGAALSLTVDAENTSATNGLRTASYDLIACEGRVTATTRTLTVHGVSIWENP